jgi:SAM-dependent methyltransferase
MMGVWSRLAGEVFLEWLSPPPSLRWIAVGCGSSRPAARVAQFSKGDAMALPFPDESFDAAVMALVVFFVPDARKGVAEMARVVRPGGIVGSYTWDILDGGFPNEPLMAAMRETGRAPPLSPSANASRMEALKELWASVHLEKIDTREITVARTFRDFDDL